MEKRRNEIGSEFWDVPMADQPTHVFSGSTQWFLSGRCALQAIIQELKDCRTVSMPSWCCGSMVKPFLDAGFEVRFYPVFWEDGLVQEIDLHSDVLVVMDYFGYTGAPLSLTGYRGVVIRDVTHSFFSLTHSDATYSFGSLRKWCGVWTGGFAWTDDGHELQTGQGDDHGFVSLRKEGMLLKQRYIVGKGGEDKGYLDLFHAAENALERVGVVPAAQRDIECAKRLDTAAMTIARRTNAGILRDAFREWLLFPQTKETDCPMFVPVLVPDGKRDALRQYLMQNEIYCPIHWPISDLHRLDKRTGQIYENELSLVCDQRYSQEDMYHMVTLINRFWKEA